MPVNFGNAGCALARQRLAKTVADLREAPLREKVVSGMKAGFLGSVVTPLKMMGGNAMSLGLRTLAVHPLEAGVDYVRAVAKSAREGKMTLAPDELRAVQLALDSEGFKRAAQAFGRGLSPTKGALKEARSVFQQTDGAWNAARNAVITFADELNTRLDAEQINRTVDYQGSTHYHNPLSNAAVNLVFGIAEALDRPFWRSAHDFSLWVQGKTLAAAEGLKGDALTARASELFDRPTDEMAMRAIDHANYVTFKNKTVLGTIAQDVKTGLARRADKPITPEMSLRERAQKTAFGTAAFVAESNLPFTGVPSSVAGQAYSLGTGPLSLVRLVSEANRSPARAATIIAEAGLGTGLIALGYEMAAKGDLVGPAPSSDSERSQMDTEGKRPISARIGDKWIDLRFAMPVTVPLFTGAALFWSKGKTPEKKALAGVGNVSRLLTSQTYLQNFDALVQAMNSPVNRGPRLIASQVPIPAVLGQVARASDPLERDPKTIGELIASRLPGLSRTVPARIDALGRPMQRTAIERLSEVALPFRISQSTETPVTKAFRNAGTNLTRPSESVTLGGEEITRTPDEQSVYAQRVGKLLDDYLRQMIATPQFQQLSQEQQARVLENVRDRFHAVYGRADAISRLPAASVGYNKNNPFANVP